MKFDNLDDLFRYIEKQTQDVMKKEVADEVKTEGYPTWTTMMCMKSLTVLR